MKGVCRYPLGMFNVDPVTKKNRKSCSRSWKSFASGYPLNQCIFTKENSPGATCFKGPFQGVLPLDSQSSFPVDCKQFISDTSSTLQWIIINNLLHKINHHSKNHTSSLDPKICDGKKKTPSRCCSCGSASTGPRIPDYRGITALHHSLSTALTVSCCPNFRA